jgi:hypothetical protein
MALIERSTVGRSRNHHGPHLPDDPPTSPATQPVVSLDLRTPLGEVSLFRVIATLGAPLEVTAANLALETFPPMDERSAARLSELSARREENDCAPAPAHRATDDPRSPRAGSRLERVSLRPQSPCLSDLGPVSRVAGSGCGGSDAGSLRVSRTGFHGDRVWLPLLIFERDIDLVPGASRASHLGAGTSASWRAQPATWLRRAPAPLSVPRPCAVRGAARRRV